MISRLDHLFGIINHEDFKRVILNIIASEAITPDQKYDLLFTKIRVAFEILEMESVKKSMGESITRESISDSLSSMDIESLRNLNTNLYSKCVKDAMIKGVNWLLKNVCADGRWEHENADNKQPVSSVWYTSFSLLALRKTRKFCDNKDEINKTIDKGIKWLQENQNKTEKGWLGPHGISVYETSAALYCLSSLDYANSQEVKNAVKFLLKWQNKFNGGWVAKKWDKYSEVGATSFAIVSLSEYLKRADDNEIYLFDTDAVFLEDKLDKCILKDLRKVFESEGFPLSENARIIKEKDYKWKIMDEERSYTYNIKKNKREYGKLKIYGKIDESIKKGVEWFIHNKNQENTYCYWGVPDKNYWYWNISKTCDGINALSKLSELDKYLFSWDDVLGGDNEQFIEFLNSELKIKWVKNVKIKKSGGGKSIIITNEGKSLLFKLNLEKSKAILEIDGVTTCEYFLKEENGKRNLYDYKIDRDNKTIIIMINGGINWLLARRGVFKKGDIIGVGWHDLVNTSLVIENLIKVADIQSVPLRPNVDWLIKQQKEDGSWGTETPRMILALNSYLSKLEEDPLFEYIPFLNDLD